MDLNPVVLEGRHARLEPLAPSHDEALAAVGLDPTLWAWTPSAVRTAAEMRAYVASALEAQRAGTALPFAIRRLSDGKIVGSTRYGNADPANRRLEIGWTWIAPEAQRTAINTEAKYLLLRHAFETLGAIRVELRTDRLNVRSREAILRIGATEEGTFRQHMITAGGRLRDTVTFSILDSEWPGVKARLEARLGS